jgi:excisionase family DNA binding protein
MITGERPHLDPPPHRAVQAGPRDRSEHASNWCSRLGSCWLQRFGHSWRALGSAFLIRLGSSRSRRRDPNWCVAVGAVLESTSYVARLGLAVVTADRSRCCLGVGEGRWRRECEAMTAVDAEGGAVGGVRHRTRRERREPTGRLRPFRSKSKISLSGGTPRDSWSLSACPQVPAAIAKYRSFRTIQMYGRPTRGRFRGSGRDQKSTSGRGADLGTGWKGVLNMGRRTELADVPAVLYGVEEAAAALRLSRSVLYELIRSGQLRTAKQGRRRLVPVPAFG